MESIATLPTTKPTESSPAPAWMKRVPMITGALAGLAGFLTVRSANTSNEAIYNSNQSVLHQTLASDAWAEYQADSIKRHIDENSLMTGNPDAASRAKIQADISDLNDRQAKSKITAKDEETKRTSQLQDSHEKLAIKDLLDYAGVAAQLGIALASIAALTRVRQAYHLAILIGSVAVAITAYGVAGASIARLVWHH